MNFPDMIKAMDDVLVYSMDWTSRLASGTKIESADITINGDVTIDDKTTYPDTVLKLQVSGGMDMGFTGDPQLTQLHVITVLAHLSDGGQMARSFNVRVRQM